MVVAKERNENEKLIIIMYDVLEKLKFLFDEPSVKTKDS